MSKSEMDVEWPGENQPTASQVIVHAILEFQNREQFTEQELIEHSGLTQSTVNRVLRSLRSDGKIELIDQTETNAYVYTFTNA